MNILIVGGGGREHALAWAIRQSPQVRQIFVAPGNAGTALIGRNLPIKATDIPALAQAVREFQIDLTVVGPEQPLSQGIVDYFNSQGLSIFGPTQAAAQIEASKAFAKELMFKYGIPCARSRTFSSLSQARAYVESQEVPIVVKADGLAGGKGAIVALSRQEALTTLSDIMEKRLFGPAGAHVVIEEYLEGREVSLLAFTDGQAVVPMVPACDYKRRDEGDRGPNTGGMGSYSPPPFFGQPLIQRTTRAILEPAVEALAKEGRPYKGVLYAGLMVTREGPKVLEFNARFGDPETQVILPRLKSDLVGIMQAVLSGKLGENRLEWNTQACVGVVLASRGYPESYKTGYPIWGLDSLPRDIIVFHAGTRQEAGQMLTDGGRVLTVVATGPTLTQARGRVYQHIPSVSFEGCYYRRDIARQKE